MAFKTPYPCYDCGSTHHNHHTLTCEFAEPRSRRDLPSKRGTQWWNGKPPIRASTQAIRELYKQIPDRALTKAEIKRFESEFRKLAKHAQSRP